MSTISIRDANNQLVDVELPLRPGRDVAANSRPVVLSVEDKNRLDDIYSSITTNRIGAIVDKSGTITTGETSQEVAAANASRKYFIIQNPYDANGSLYVNFGVAANVTHGLEILPGGSYSMPDGGFITNSSITATANDTGHVFIAKEG